MRDTQLVAGQIARQFEAVFEMLKVAIEKCPEALWSSEERKPLFWHEAYHALFWCDNFVGNKDKAFEFQPVGVDIDPRLFSVPKATVAKNNLLKLLATARGHVAQRLNAMTDADLSADDAYCEDGDAAQFDVVLHRILYALRHGQHHVGRLACRLWASGISLDAWHG